MPVDWNRLIPTRKSLLSRLKHWDDQKSWQDFYEIYHRLIFGAAIKAGLTETEAEDAVQETVTAVANAIRVFKYEPEKCAFKTWLHAIAKRQVANQFRKREGRGRLLEPLPSADEDDSPVNELPDPAGQVLDEMWEREWEQNLLDAAINRVKRRVSPAQFQIFEYHVCQGHSASQTARDLDITEAKVYLAKHRISALVMAEVAYLRTKHV